MDATTIAGLHDERSEGIEARYDSRSYRCALHIGAMLRRPRTVRFQWQGILREVKGTEVVRFSYACSMQSFQPRRKPCISRFAKN
jgi:hypothetical protein